MRHPATNLDAGRSGGDPGDAGTAREDYLNRLSALLGVDRTRMITSAWSGDTVPFWLQEDRPEPAPVRTVSRRKDGLSLIRQTTMMCVTAALGSCLFLYWGKSQAALADRDIGRIVRATQDAHARVYALRTEWALLNEPDRLRDIADHHLTLRPVSPAQFAELSKLQDRLPAPVATPAEGSPEADAALASEEAIQPPIQNAASVINVASGPAAEPPAAIAQEPAERVAPLAKPAAAAPPAVVTPTAVQDVVRPEAVASDAVVAPSDQGAAQTEPAAEALPRHAKLHSLARPVPDPKYLTPMVAEARQPLRLRDSGEAMLNGDTEVAHLHGHVVRAAAYAASSALARAEQAVRTQHHMPAPKIDLPHWLMEAHLARISRFDPPHRLGVPQADAISPAAPRPEAAAVQRVVARPAQEQEPQTQPQTYETQPQYHPALRQNYAYGGQYRSYDGQGYGVYGGGGYGNRTYYGPYGGGYSSPYDRGASPPPPPPGYYQ